MKWFGALLATSTVICTTVFSAAAEAAGTRLDPVTHPYIQTASNVSCTPDANCKIVFPTATAPETLVQHVSCQYNLVTGAVTIDALAINNTTGDQNNLEVFNYANGGGDSIVRGINANTYLFLQTGESAAVVIVPHGGAVKPLSCTVSGYHD
jgi:hypothetical protein